MSTNVGFICQNEDLAKLFRDIAHEKKINTIVELSSFKKAEDAALKLEEKLDVILSRGGTAEYIRKVVKIPVVSIPITAIDILRAVYSAKKVSSTIAFAKYKCSELNKSDIEDMLGVNILEYIFTSELQIEDIMNDIEKKGIRVIVGGSTINKAAEQHGIESVLIRSGKESVRQSIDEALHLVEVRRAEINRNARFKAILDSIEEGIIVTDEKEKITSCNPSIKRMLHKSSKEMIGKCIKDVISNCAVDNVLKNGNPQTALIKDLHGINIAENIFPIKVQNKLIGAVSTFEDITKIQILEQKIREKIHEKGFLAKYTFNDILTDNEHMEDIKELALLYANTDSSVLIQGESGTGKELFAQSIHNASNRSKGPFVAINCAAIPEQLLESELFGYEGGAFTGAKKDGKQGLFELAHNGTIFLDEIGEISKSIQARLLRVLEEREIMRVGGDKIIPVDIRIISATNRNLEKQMDDNKFRKDLYYRLNVFSLKLTSLRERKEDIAVLTKNFFQKANICVDYDDILNNLVPILSSYEWPGNVRELYNILERVSLFLSRYKNIKWAQILKKVMYKSDRQDLITLKVSMNSNMKSIISCVEKEVIDNMMIKYNYDQDKVAKKLEIGRTTLWRKKRGFKH